MSIARDPSGNECALKVTAAGSLYTAAGTLLSADDAAPSDLIYGEMRMFGVDPGYPWIMADGRAVTSRGKQHTLPRSNHMYVYLPE